MTDKSFVIIRGWMVRRLLLNGTPLILYACIYGKHSKFQEKTSEFSLKDFGAGNGQLVTKALKFLKDNGFIEESEEVSDKGFKNKMYAPSIKKLDETDVPKEIR